MTRLFKEVFRYGVVATAALATDVSMLLVLVQHVHWLVAIGLSFSSGTLLAYFLSVRFVFEHRRINSRNTEALLFFLFGAIGLITCYAVVAALTQWAGLPLLTAKAIASSITFLMGFALRRIVLFAAEPSESAQKQGTTLQASST